MTGRSARVRKGLACYRDEPEIVTGRFECHRKDTIRRVIEYDAVRRAAA